MRKLIIALSLLTAVTVLALPEFPCHDCTTAIEFRDAGIFEMKRRGWMISGPVTIVNAKGFKVDVEIRVTLARGISYKGVGVPNFEKATFDVEAQTGAFQHYFDLKLTTIGTIYKVEYMRRLSKSPAPSIYKYLEAFPPPSAKKTYIQPNGGGYVQGFTSTRSCAYCESGNSPGTGYWRAPSYGPTVGATRNEYDIGAMDNREIGREWLADAIKATGLTARELSYYMAGTHAKSVVSRVPAITPVRRAVPVRRYVRVTRYTVRYRPRGSRYVPRRYM